MCCCGCTLVSAIVEASNGDRSQGQHARRLSLAPIVEAPSLRPTMAAPRRLCGWLLASLRVRAAGTVHAHWKTLQ